MLQKVKKTLKDKRGQVIPTDLVMALAVAAIIASVFTAGVTTVFTGGKDDGTGGVIGNFQKSINEKFEKAGIAD